MKNILIILITLSCISCDKNIHQIKNTENQEKKYSLEKLFTFSAILTDIGDGKSSAVYTNDSLFCLHYKETGFAKSTNDILDEQFVVFKKGKVIESINMKDKDWLHKIGQWKSITKNKNLNKFLNIDYDVLIKSNKKVCYDTKDYKIKEDDGNFFLLYKSSEILIPLQKSDFKPDFISFNSLDINNDLKKELFVFRTRINQYWGNLETEADVYSIESN